MERSATSSIRRRLVPRLPRRAWILIAGACGFYGSVGFVSAFLVIYLHDVRGIGLGIAGVALGATAFAGLGADRIGEFWGYPESRTFAELLIDAEEDRVLRAVLIGMLRHHDRYGRWER